MTRMVHLVARGNEAMAARRPLLLLATPRRAQAASGKERNSARLALRTSRKFLG